MYIIEYFDGLENANLTQSWMTSFIDSFDKNTRILTDRDIVDGVVVTVCRNDIKEQN